MYGPMAHHYGNDVTALTPGSTEGSAHGTYQLKEQGMETLMLPLPSAKTKEIWLFYDHYYYFLFFSFVRKP